MSNAQWMMIAMLAVLNAPVFWFLRPVFFSDWSEFGHAIRFWFTPDLWSFFKGEFMEDFWAELKLGAMMQFLSAMG